MMLCKVDRSLHDIYYALSRGKSRGGGSGVDFGGLEFITKKVFEENVVLKEDRPGKVTPLLPLEFLL